MNLKKISRKRRRRSNSAIVIGRTNIFADLGRKDAAEAMAKVQLAYRIHALIDDSGLNQTQAASLLGVDQPKVSNLMRGRLRGFSIDRLFRFLNLLGQDVEVRLREAKQNRGSVRVFARAS